jgi:cystathionine gamma-synthase
VRLSKRLVVCPAAVSENPSVAGTNGVVSKQPQQQHHQQQQEQQELQGVGSRSIHEGERSGRQDYHDSLTTPIAQTSTYFFDNTQQVIDFNEGRRDSHEYGRYGNPTVKAVQEKLRALEGAEDCIVSASGMSSVTSMLLSLVPAGGHIVTTSDCYWRTRQFMQQFLPKMNIGVSVIAPDDIGALEQALDSNPVTLYFSESPTNPYLRCIDIQRVCDLCHAKVR